MPYIPYASGRIYEKSAHDADFLALTVGYYKSETSAEIKYSQNDIALETEELEDEVKEIIKEFSEIDYKPLLVDLLLTNLGLVGNKDIIHEQLHVLIAKLCFEISYLDMEIVLFIDENDWNEFRYLQWYPHFQIEALGSSGLIYNGDVADQILLSMHKIIKMRELESESNNKKDIKYNPHFVFIIDDESLVQNHVIMEYFSKNINYGYSLIYTSSIQDSLPENIQTVIKYKNKDQGILVINNRILENKLFYLDRIGDVKTEWLAAIKAGGQIVIGMSLLQN